MKKQKNKKIKAGFMMVEMVLAIFILGTILISFVQIISKTYAAKNDKIDIVIATGLAQEGIEMVRNVRDRRWMSGVAAIPGTWVSSDKTIKYNVNAPLPNVTTCPSGRCPLRVDANGFYTTDAGTATNFSRKVNVIINGTDELIVTSTVYWNGVARGIQLSETLNNWGDKIP